MKQHKLDLYEIFSHNRILKYGTDDLRKVRKKYPHIEFTRERCEELFKSRSRTFRAYSLSTKDRHMRKLYEKLASAYTYCALVVSNQSVFDREYSYNCCPYLLSDDDFLLDND